MKVISPDLDIGGYQLMDLARLNDHKIMQKDYIKDETEGNIQILKNKKRENWQK